MERPVGADINRDTDLDTWKQMQAEQERRYRENPDTFPKRKRFEAYNAAFAENRRLLEEARERQTAAEQPPKTFFGHVWKRVTTAFQSIFGQQEPVLLGPEPELTHDEWLLQTNPKYLPHHLKPENVQEHVRKTVDDICKAYPIPEIPKKPYDPVEEAEFRALARTPTPPPSPIRSRPIHELIKDSSELLPEGWLATPGDIDLYFTEDNYLRIRGLAAYETTPTKRIKVEIDEVEDMSRYNERQKYCKDKGYINWKKCTSDAAYNDVLDEEALRNKARLWLLKQAHPERIGLDGLPKHPKKPKPKTGQRVNSDTANLNPSLTKAKRQHKPKDPNQLAYFYPDFKLLEPRKREQNWERCQWEDKQLAARIRWEQWPVFEPKSTASTDPKDYPRNPPKRYIVEGKVDIEAMEHDDQSDTDSELDDPANAPLFGTDEFYEWHNLKYMHQYRKNMRRTKLRRERNDAFLRRMANSKNPRDRNFATLWNYCAGRSAKVQLMMQRARMKNKEGLKEDLEELRKIPVSAKLPYCDTLALDAVPSPPRKPPSSPILHPYCPDEGDLPDATPPKKTVTWVESQITGRPEISSKIYHQSLPMNVDLRKEKADCRHLPLSKRLRPEHLEDPEQSELTIMSVHEDSFQENMRNQSPRTTVPVDEAAPATDALAGYHVSTRPWCLDDDDDMTPSAEWVAIKEAERRVKAAKKAKEAEEAQKAEEARKVEEARKPEEARKVEEAQKAKEAEEATQKSLESENIDVTQYSEGISAAIADDTLYIDEQKLGEVTYRTPVQQRLADASEVEESLHQSWLQRGRDARPVANFDFDEDSILEGTPTQALYDEATVISDDGESEGELDETSSEEYEEEEDEEEAVSESEDRESSPTIPPAAPASVTAPLLQTIIPQLSAENAAAVESAVRKGLRATTNQLGTRFASGHDLSTILSSKYGGSAAGVSGWCNDTIIDEYMNAIQVLADNQKSYTLTKSKYARPVHIWSSQWAKDPKKLDRWSRRPCLFGTQILQSELLLFPTCSGNHWTLIAVRPQGRVIENYDSLGGSGHQYTQMIRNWLAENLGSAYDQSEWTVRQGRTGMQSNGSDCGVFVCMNAEAVVRGLEPKTWVQPGRMALAREKVVAVILKGFEQAGLEFTVA